MQIVRDPKIVFWDLETIPDWLEIRKVYPRLSDYPGLTLKASITSIICFGYKILGHDKAHCVNAWDFPERWAANINDDYEVVKAAYEVLKDADAVVTHNGKRFDWKYLQTRLVKHGFPPLAKVDHIDTCMVAKQHLLLFNNRLTTVGKFLVDEDKLENGGWDLWVRVCERDPEAQKLMSEYCIQDVALLEKVFRVMRPFMSNIPNHNLFTAEYTTGHVCPSCGSTRINKYGTRITKTKVYQRYRCVDCHSVSRTDIEDRMPRSI